MAIPLFDQVIATKAVQPDAMNLVETDRAAVRDVECIDQFPSVGTQKSIFIGSFHLGNDHGGHYGDQGENHHEFEQGEGRRNSKSQLPNPKKLPSSKCQRPPASSSG